MVPISTNRLTTILHLDNSASRRSTKIKQCLSQSMGSARSNCPEPSRTWTENYRWNDKAGEKRVIFAHSSTRRPRQKLNAAEWELVLLKMSKLIYMSRIYIWFTATGFAGKLNENNIISGNLVHLCICLGNCEEEIVFSLKNCVKRWKVRKPSIQYSFSVATRYKTTNYTANHHFPSNLE